MAVTRIPGLLMWARNQVRVLEGPLSMLARLIALFLPNRCRRVLGTRLRTRLRPRGLLPQRKPLRLPLLLENLHMMSERYVITTMPFFIMYYSPSSSLYCRDTFLTVTQAWKAIISSYLHSNVVILKYFGACSRSYDCIHLLSLSYLQSCSWFACLLNLLSCSNLYHRID
jgi:hypothetical protein